MVVSLGAPDSLGLEFDFVIDTSAWKCCALGVLVPGDATKGGLAAKGCLHICPHGEPEKLLPFSIKRGLRNLTVSSLKKLFNFLGVPFEKGNRHMIESALMEALSKHVLGDSCTQEVVSEVMMKRAAEPSADDISMGPPLWTGDTKSVPQEEIDDEDLQQEVAKFLAKVQAKELKRPSQLAQLSRLEPGKAASPQPSPGPLQRQPVQWKHGVGMPQVDAKVFLPPGASLSKESTWHHRWKIQAKYLGQRSRCFPQVMLRLTMQP